MPPAALPASVRRVAPCVLLALALVPACGARATVDEGATAAARPTTGGADATLPPVGIDLSHVAAPLVDVLGPADDSVIARAALVKSDAPPTDAWNAEAALFGRAFCIGETCFELALEGERAVPAGSTLTAVGSAGACEVALTRARAVRAHLPARGEAPAVEQSFLLLELGACAASPDARLEAVFGADPVSILSLRDRAWQPASAELSAALEAREEVNRSLTPDRQRVPIVAAEIPQCGITLARGLAVYWIRDGSVHQPFDAARFVAAGGALYAFSYVEGLDPLLERLDRVTCAVE